MIFKCNEGKPNPWAFESGFHYINIHITLLSFFEKCESKIQEFFFVILFKNHCINMTEWSAETANKLELIDMYVQCTVYIHMYVSFL